MLGASLFPHVLTAEKKREILLHDKCGVDAACFIVFPLPVSRKEEGGTAARQVRRRWCAPHCSPPFLAAEEMRERLLHGKCGVDVGCFSAFPLLLTADWKRGILLHDKCGFDVGCFIAFPLLLTADRKKGVLLHDKCGFDAGCLDCCGEGAVE